jgi:acyl-[acyl carrier protein]--UDP-N-acetylglucosamine O-acyltransferase
MRPIVQRALTGKRGKGLSCPPGGGPAGLRRKEMDKEKASRLREAYTYIFT